jgi:hypothetical protein
MNPDVVRYGAEAKINDILGKKNADVSLANMLKLTRRAKKEKERT